MVEGERQVMAGTGEHQENRKQLAKKSKRKDCGKKEEIGDFVWFIKNRDSAG
jgi:hypothetical protein